MDILSRLVELQKQRGWSDYKIAKEAGLSPNTVSNIYRRNNVPNLVTLEAICKAFGITLSQFFAEDNLVELTPEQRQLFEKSELSEFACTLHNGYSVHSRCHIASECGIRHEI